MHVFYNLCVISNAKMVSQTYKYIVMLNVAVMVL